MNSHESARRYYHKCIKLPIAMQTGMTPEETHETMLVMFALIAVYDTYYEVESTMNMSFDRLMMFINQVTAFAVSDLGVSIDSTFRDYDTKIINK